MSDLALSFAREVLGWSDAIPKVVIGATAIGRQSDPEAELFHNDLNDVLQQVKEWVGRHQCQAQLTITVLGAYGVSIVRFNGSWDEAVGAALRQNACEALMSALVDAARKLKARAA